MRRSVLVFPIIITVLLLLCLLPASARAESIGNCGKDAMWKLDDEGTLTISGTGEVTVPSRKKQPWSVYKVKTVRIEDGITSIGAEVFYNHYNLQEVDLGGTVAILGERSFNFCSKLTSVSIPDSVTNIGEYAFSCCYALEEVSFGGGLTVLGNGAFSECAALLCVNIPGSVEKVGDYAFSSCDSLVEATVADGVSELGEGAFAYCEALTDLHISDSVKRIGEDAFSCCSSLQNVRIPAGVTEIEEMAFNYCESVEKFETDAANSAFAAVDGVLFSSDGTRLLAYPAGRHDSEYVIPDTVTSVDAGAFSGADELCTITFPGSVKTARLGYYEGLASLKKVILLDGVETIGECAFAGCEALEEVVFPQTLKTVKTFAFQDTALKSAVLPDSVEVLEDHAFYSSAIKEVRIPDKVTVLPEAAFYCCYGLETVTIPDSVTEIGDRAFSECGALKTVCLGEGVQTVSYDAFDQCGSLSEIHYGGTKNSWRAIRNLSVELLSAEVYDKNGRVIPPEFPDLAELGQCGNEMVWYYCSDGSLTIRGNGSMEDYWYKTDISYGSSGTRYDTSQFTYPWNEYGDSIRTVTVGEGVEYIGQSAFSQIESLKSVYLPESLKKVGDGAFNNTGLILVYYAGTRDQWSGVAKGLYNEPLKNADLFRWVKEPVVELREQDGSRFTLSLELSEDSQLWIAWYDAQGRFLCCSYETLGADEKEYTCSASPDCAAACRVFLTGEDHCPLCGEVSVS